MYVNMRLTTSKCGFRGVCMTQIGPCDGHVNQIPHYVSIHSGILQKVSFIYT